MAWDFDPISQPNDAPDAPKTGATPGDVVKSVGAGALDTVAQPFSAAQYAAEQAGAPNVGKLARGFSKLFHALSGDVDDSISEGGKRALNATIIPEDGKASVTEAPMSSFMMKAGRLAPGFAVMALFPESLIGAAMAGGATQAVQVADQVISKSNSLPDDTLKQQSPVYAHLRETMSEEDARTKLHGMQLNGKDLLVAGITGAATMGPAARVFKGAATAEQGALKGALTGGAEAGLGMAVAGAQSNYAAQNADVVSGAQKAIDWHRTLMTGLNSGLEMGVFGAGAGALHGALSKKPEAASPKGVEAVTERGPDAAQTVALRPDAPATPEVAPATPEVAPAPATPPVGRKAAGRKAAAREVAPPAEATSAPEAAAPVPEAVAPVAPEAAPTPETAAPSRATAATEDLSNTASKVNDTPTVPETQDTIDVQRQALKDGERAAVMYPASMKEVPPPMEGFKRVKTEKGVFDYDSKQVKAKEIMAAVKSGRENEILDLGSKNKADVAESAAKGNPEVAVVERTPEGTEAKAAAGTTETVPQQIAEMQPSVSPGNKLELTTPQQVIADRKAATVKAPKAAKVMEVAKSRAKAAAEALPQKAAPKAEPKAEPKPEPEPTAVRRISNNFIQFGKAKIEVTDQGIGWQGPDGKNTLFYPDTGVFGDRRGEGRLSQMDELGVPKLIQPIYRDFFNDKIRKGDIDAVVDRLREVEQKVNAGEVKSEPKPKPKPVAKAAAEALPQKPEVTAPSKKVEPTGRVIYAEGEEAGKPLSKLEESDLTKREQKKMEASKELDPNEVGEQPTSESKGKNWDKDERARRGYNNQVADEIARAHPPTARDAKYKQEGEAGEAARNAIHDRAKAIVKEANERLLPDQKGTRIVTRFQDGTDASMNHHIHMVLIREAEALAKVKNPTIKHYESFIKREILAHSGDRELLLNDRQADGDESLKQQQGNVEGVAAVEEGPRELSGSSAEADAQPDASSYGKNDVVTAVTKSAKGQTRISDGREVITTKDENGKKVTTERQKAEPGRKIELTPELKAMYESLANSPRKMRSQAEGRAAGSAHPTADEISHRSTLGEAMRTLDLSKLNDPDRGINRGIVMKVLNRLREKVSDTELVVVDQATMDRLNPDHKGADGYYDPQRDYIAVSDRLYKNGKFDASLVAHEGVHALLQKGLESDKELKAFTQKLLDKVKDELPGEKHYGFTNVHEFVAEAMSNVEFQNVLMGIKLSAEDAHALGMGRRSATVWDSLVNAVHQFVMKARDALGISSPEYNMLSAVMRVAEHAEKHGDVIRKAEAGNADLLRHMSMGTKAKELLDKVKEKTSSAKEAGETFREQALDFNRPLEREQQNIESKLGTKLPEGERFFEDKKLMEPRIIERERQLEKSLGKEGIEVAKQAMDAGLDIDKALTAYHAIERNAEILKRDPKNTEGSGMSNKDAEALLKAIDADPKKKAAYERLVQLNKDIRDVELKTLVESGRLTQEQADKWRGMFKTYTSLKGFADEDIARAVGGKNIGLIGRQDMSVVGNGVREAGGRTTESDSPLHNMFQQARLAIVQAERNKVVKSLADAGRRAGYVKDGDHPFYVASSINDKNIGSYKAALTSPNVLGFMEGGKQKFVVFKDQALAEAVQRIRPDELPAFFRQIGQTTNSIKALWTHYSPAFVIRHYGFRYPIEALMNLTGLKERGVKADPVAYLKDAFGTVPDINRYLNGEEVKDPRVARYIKEMAEAGGIVSFKHMSDTFDLKKEVERLFNEKPQTAWDKVVNFHNAWSQVMTAMDAGERLAVYMRTRDAGMSIHESALAARAATIDFSTKGRAAGWINIWVPFGNVALQTTGRMAKAFKESPTYRKTLLSITAGLTAIEATNYTMGGNDKDGTPWIDKIPAYERTQNLVLVTPFKDSDGKPYIFKMPLPYPLFAFNATGAGAVQFAAGKMGVSKISQGEIASRVLHGAAETFTPIGRQIDSLQSLATPEVARFISDIKTNEDWKGDHIHTAFAKKGVDKADQGFKGTDDTWKTMAGMLAKIGLDMYPEDVRYTVDHFFGAERRFVRDIGEAVTNPGKALTSNPVSKIVMGSPSDQADKGRLRILTEHASFPKETLDALAIKARGGTLNGAQRGLAQAAESRSHMTAKQIIEINKVAKEIRAAQKGDGASPALMQRSLTKLNQMGVVGGFDK